MLVGGVGGGGVQSGAEADGCTGVDVFVAHCFYYYMYVIHSSLFTYLSKGKNLDISLFMFHRIKGFLTISLCSTVSLVSPG